MKRLNAPYRFCAALLLLLSFAATQLPFELFHNHTPASSCVDTKTGDSICHHKSHVGTQESYCWACTIHVEKTYKLPSVSSKIFFTYTAALYYFSTVKTYGKRDAHVSLRGPPSCAII